MDDAIDKFEAKVLQAEENAIARLKQEIYRLDVYDWKRLCAVYVDHTVTMTTIFREILADQDLYGKLIDAGVLSDPREDQS